MPIKNISLTIVALYTIIVGIIMLHAGQPTNIEWFIGALPMFAWAVGPIFLFSLFISRFPAYVTKISLVVFQLIFSLFSAYTYYDAFYVHTDAQNALVLVFLPIWQYFAAIWIAAIIKVTQLIIQKIRISRKSPTD